MRILKIVYTTNYEYENIVEKTNKLPHHKLNAL